MSFIPKVQPYAVITLDLNTERSVTATGSVITSTGETLNTWIANQMLVNSISTGGVLSVGVHDGTVAGGMITAAAGLKLNGVYFTDLYVTNTSQPGLTAEIIIAYID